MNKKAIALALSSIAAVILIVLGAATLSRSIFENRFAQNNLEITQAFWLAEGGLSRAIDELRANFNVAAGNGVWTGSGSLVNGEYSVDLSTISGQERTVISHGFIPSAASPRFVRVLRVVIRKYIPPNFYDYAIYSAGDIDFNGNTYTVVNNEPWPDNKAVMYGDDFDVQHPESITGTTNQDSSISPLARLDFQQLLSISTAQGNVYDEDRLRNVQENNDSFPGSFWFSPPTDPSDPTTGVPNVVYVTTDLQLNGNIGTIGGFFVVVGNVLTDPDNTSDATINGNGQIEGAIYTRGEFKVNGGGGNLNVNGGVWAGSEARLNGNANVAYNKDYMSAIQGLNVDPAAQIVFWEDLQQPYPVN